MKTNLTIEQSAELIRKGITNNRASGFEAVSSANPRGIGGQVAMARPVFTLADLLSLIHTMRLNPKTGKEARIVLTIAHLDHTPENCDPNNLRALCQKCHNTYDAQHRKETRMRTKAK